jgi:hypothetical protein
LHAFFQTKTSFVGVQLKTISWETLDLTGCLTFEEILLVEKSFVGVQLKTISWETLDLTGCLTFEENLSVGKQWRKPLKVTYTLDKKRFPKPSKKTSCSEITVKAELCHLPK